VLIEDLLSQLLLVLGVGFLVANLRIVSALVRYARLRRSAIVVWEGHRPPYYSAVILLAIALALILIVKLVLQRRPPMAALGEMMMFAYYAFLLPASLRISRGFYEHGVWLEGGYLPYARIGGIAWREETDITLLLVPKNRRVVRRLIVPREHYAEARRILRDRIAEHEIHFAGSTLSLEGHDEREDV